MFALVFSTVLYVICFCGGVNKCVCVWMWFSMFHFILLSCTVHMTGWLPDTVTADSIVSQNKNAKFAQRTLVCTVVRNYWILGSSAGINYVSFLISFCLFITIYLIAYCYFYWSLFFFMFTFSLYFSHTHTHIKNSKNWICLWMFTLLLSFPLKITHKKESEWPKSKK